MRIFRFKHKKRVTCGNKGAVLLFTLMVMIVLTSMVGAYLGFVQASTKSTGAQISDSKAIYIAEAGLQKYVYLLKTDQDYRDDYPDLNENFGDGSYSVQADFNQPTNTYTITSTGTVGGLSRQITESVTVTPAVLERAIHGDHDVKFDNSAGTITGNVSSVKNVKPDSLPAGLTVTGTVTDEDSDPPQSTINAFIPLGAGTTYYNLANGLDQLVVAKDGKGGKGDKGDKGDKTFDSSGSPYTGIWYMTGKATIESNVTINGVLVAEGTIEFKDGVTDIVINPKAHYTTQNYPALIAGDKIDAKVDHGVGLQDSTISGLVYAEGDIKFNNTTNITFNGTIVGLKKIELKDGTNVIVTYDAGIFTPAIPGFTYTSSNVTVTPQNDWNEL